MTNLVSIQKLLNLASFLAGTLLLGGCADLVVTDVHHAPYLTTAAAVKVKVKNVGSRGASASMTKVEVKPAGSSVFTRSMDVSTSALPAGQEIELFPTVLVYPNEIPAPGSGQCLEMRACADSGQTVSESVSGEANNCKTTSECR